MKKILLVALMALCAASLSYAEDPLAECLEKCQGKQGKDDCLEDCAIEKASEQQTQQPDDIAREQHDLDIKRAAPGE